MNKRNLASVLWFFAGWVGVGGILAMAALPPNLGIVVGILVAGLVWWDPRGAIWGPKPTSRRRIRPINEVAAELDRQSAAGSVDPERVAR